MLSVNELSQSEMDVITLSLFNYVTQGTSSEVEFDYDMLSEIELNFED